MRQVFNILNVTVFFLFLNFKTLFLHKIVFKVSCIISENYKLLGTDSQLIMDLPRK